MTATATKTKKQISLAEYLRLKKDLDENHWRINNEVVTPQHLRDAWGNIEELWELEAFALFDSSLLHDCPTKKDAQVEAVRLIEKHWGEEAITEMTEEGVKITFRGRQIFCDIFGELDPGVWEFGWREGYDRTTQDYAMGLLKQKFEKHFGMDAMAKFIEEENLPFRPAELVFLMEDRLSESPEIPGF